MGQLPGLSSNAGRVSCQVQFYRIPCYSHGIAFISYCTMRLCSMSDRTNVNNLILGTLGFVFLSFTSVSSAQSVTNFQQWIKDFYPQAAEQGISRTVYEQAFIGITNPDERVLEKAQYQPEFTTEIWDYLDARVTSGAVAMGETKKEQYGSTLAAIERRYGVRDSVLLAIWSMETSYGAALLRTNRLHYVPRALATLGYGDKKRAKFARSQLIAALKILQAGDVSGQGLTGSWAGAMGHTQFIPTSYLAYGVDMDGDGRRDIWNSIPDALATAANLLHKNKWQTGKTWGYEVLAPVTVSEKELGTTRTLSEWQRLGFRRPLDKPFPRQGDRAVLKMPAGVKGPAFLVLKNFFVLKRYNNSDFYALAVGMLADQIAGYSGMVQKWPRPAGSLSMADKYELQTRLKEKGYYAGTIDGSIGSGTRGAIRAFQQYSGMAPTGKPSQELLTALRGK